MIKLGSALMDAAEELYRERGIPKDIITRSLSDAMVTAYKKYAHLPDATGVRAEIDEEAGEIVIYLDKQVVEEETENHFEISLEEAKKIADEAEVGDTLTFEVTPKDFGRIAAQSAKQVITQRIREAERKLILDQFLSKKSTMVTGIVQRVENRNVIVHIGKIEAIMPPREQVPGEYYRVGDKIRVYVLDVKETTKLPQVIVSQAHTMIVQELFELEVPEIEDGLVEIKAIAREAGYRTKIAVYSADSEIDAQGACIGPMGSRIQAIVNELKNEKIDIIKYSPDPVEYIINSLSPARNVIDVQLNDDDLENPIAFVVVPDDQLSLAIGKAGQNVRLAAKLTSWKIDIKSLSQIQQEMDALEEPPA